MDGLSAVVGEQPIKFDGANLEGHARDQHAAFRGRARHRSSCLLHFSTSALVCSLSALCKKRSCMAVHCVRSVVGFANDSRLNVRVSCTPRAAFDAKCERPRLPRVRA
eukprot:6214321-Pleurochrysis_carterae.AAC.8